MKVLVFTSSYYKRPYMLRQSILSGLNQNYKDMIHSINITSDSTTLTKDFSPLYEDLIGNFIVNQSENSVAGFSHFNNMKTIKFISDYESYDLFVKMDDDDIYKKHYVETIVDFFNTNPSTDIVSSKITYQLNGYELCVRGVDKFDNLGGNPGDTNYAMPLTFAFTKRALDAIINLTINDVNGHDDMMWRTAWYKQGLKHSLIDNSDNVIWNIHGENASVGYFLRK